MGATRGYLGKALLTGTKCALQDLKTNFTYPRDRENVAQILWERGTISPASIKRAGTMESLNNKKRSLAKDLAGESSKMAPNLRGNGRGGAFHFLSGGT